MDLEFRAPVKRDEQPGGLFVGGTRRLSFPGGAGNGFPAASGITAAGGAVIMEHGNAVLPLPIGSENDQERGYVRTVGRWGSEWPS